MTDRLSIFVDQEADGSDISDHAATGAWVSVEDDQGHLHLAASTELGRTVMSRNLHREVPKETFAAARNLSELPECRGSTFSRISTLLGNNL